MKQKKAQVVLYFLFIFVAILIVVITAVIAPLGAEISTKAYEAGDNILQSSREDSLDIEDANARARINGTFTAALGATEDNIDIMAGLFQYSWFIVIFIVGIILFLVARQLQEVGGGIV